MKVVIRDDDTSYFTKVEDISCAYDFLSEEDCISLSIVPYTVPMHKDDVFPYGKGIKGGYYDIADNRKLVDYLINKHRQGKFDFLLHGYTHEYMLVRNKWIAEMKWKGIEQLNKELTEGKKHLENLLGTKISVFVAPNNIIDKKAIEVIEKLRMNYSGIIGVFDRKINLKYSVNFIKRWGFRLLKKIQYPQIMDYGKHKELNAYTLDSYERLVYEYKTCKERGTPFVIYTHYWKLNEGSKEKELLKRIYEYVIKDGAKVVPLSECF